ncbi:MAG: ABC transporter permease [Saprospiraceae bacterium]|nr:ABC transporter permease [Saprospiraceae bacterium]
MLKNYIKIALRNLLKNKVFSLINILGLSIGMACCMTILLWVKHELSYDKHHEQAENLYRVWTTLLIQDDVLDFAGTPTPMGPTLKLEYPEVQTMTRLLAPLGESQSILQLRNSTGEVTESFYEDNGYMVDSTFFDIFKYDFIEGNPKTVLTEPNTVVLSEEIAEKLFPGKNAMGEMVRISNSNGDVDFRITGVFATPKKPTHIPGRFYMSLYSGNIWEYMRTVTNMAGNNFLKTYIRLKPGSDGKAFEAKLPAFLEKYAAEDLKNAGMNKIQHVQPITDIHLHSNLEYEFPNTGNINYVYILASIALLTLLIACINFMNLSTARSGTRAAEVGIRKVMGAEKQRLIRQFIGESMIISLFSLLIAIVTVEVFLPVFNQMTGKELSLLAQPSGLLWFVGIALITGLLAGSYPAFYLFFFNPTTVLKGKLTNSLSATTLRRGMVVFQFIISIVLIAASLFINQQMDYIQNRNLGFNKDQQVIIPLRSGNAKRTSQALKDEVIRSTQVKAATLASTYPGIPIPFDLPLFAEGQTNNDFKVVRVNHADADYAKTLALEMVAGRFFSPDFPADSTNRLVINEAAVKGFGFPSSEEAIGKSLFIEFGDTRFTFEVVGVMKDFNFESLHKEVTPHGIILPTNSFAQPPGYLLVNTNAENISGALSKLENAWRSNNPDEPFEYSFLDEDFQKNYEAEQRISSIIWYFTFIAIFISCLGLFGLAAFTAERRTKEIGIRKVLGASVSSIVTLLSKEFLLLVTIAFLIATPIAWYGANRWLEGFAYRIPIQWWVFAIAGILALAIALFTISFQAIRAAVANPVESLKNE